MRAWKGSIVLALVVACGTPEDESVTDDTNLTDDTESPDTDDTDGTTETDETDETDGTTETDETEDTDVVAITWPTTAESYTFEGATYLSSFDIPPATGASACCRDWGAVSKNGVGKTDNALGGLAAGVKAFIDLEEQLDATVESGSFVALLDHRLLPVSGTGKYVLGFFLGDYEGDTTYDEASIGEGTFTCDPDSFVGATGTPAVFFPSADLTSNVLHAENGNFAIALALLDINLVVPVQDVTIDGTLAVDGASVAVTEGTLSGVVDVADFFSAYNDVVAAGCGCAGLAGDLFTFDTTNLEWNNDCKTNASVDAACTAPGEDICAALVGKDVFNGGYCALLGGLFPTLADIDTDPTANGYEGLSIGLKYEGVGVSDVTGLTP